MFVSARKLITASSATGFSLIELMVAMTIVAILATIGIIMFSGAQIGAKDAKRKGDLNDIKKAMYLFQANANTFCPTKFLTSPVDCTSTNPWGAFVNDTRYGLNSAALVTTDEGKISWKTTIATYLKQTGSSGHDYKAALTSPAGYNSDTYSNLPGSVGDLAANVWPDYYIEVTGDATFKIYAQLEGVRAATSECGILEPTVGNKATITGGINAGVTSKRFNFCITQ